MDDLDYSKHLFQFAVATGASANANASAVANAVASQMLICFNLA